MGKGETETDELEMVCKALFGSQFVGVVASDEFSGKKHGYYIINLDRHTQPGSHWVGCIRPENTDYAIIYDTYGREVFGGASQWHYVDPIVQEGVSGSDCGQRCVAFLVTCHDLNLY